MPQADTDAHRAPKTAAVVALALLLPLLASPAAAQRKVELYAPKHRVADELLPVARTVLHGSGDVALDRHTGALVLIGEPSAVAEAVTVLERLDRPPRTIVLRYDRRQLGELEARGFEVRWTVEAGGLRIGNVRPPLPQGSSLEVRTSESMRQLVESFGAVARVTEGSSARIETGTSIPYQVRGGHRSSSPPARRAGPTGTAWVDATSGFETSARILDDGRVQVDLASFAARPGQGGRIDKTSSSSDLIVTPGRTVAVAGLEQSRETSQQQPLRGARSGSMRDETVLLLHVEIE